SPRSPTRVTASRSLESAHLPSGPPRGRSWGRESLREGSQRLRESSRCGPAPAQSHRAEECHTPALPERIRSATWPLLLSSPERGRFCSECPGGEYELSLSPVRFR